MGSKAKDCNFQGDGQEKCPGETKKKSFEGGGCVVSGKRHPAPRGSMSMLHVPLRGINHKRILVSLGVFRTKCH